MGHRIHAAYDLLACHILINTTAGLGDGYRPYQHHEGADHHYDTWIRRTPRTILHTENRHYQVVLPIRIRRIVRTVIHPRR